MSTSRLERQVPGMSCQGCVKRMREAIQARDSAADVTGFPAEKRLAVTTTLDDVTLDQILQEAGYPAGEESSASESQPQPQPKTETTEADPSTPSARTGGTTHRLAISGMTCASCVRSVQQALERTPGVATAMVNFGTQVAQVHGQAEADTLIKAIEGAGYDAEPIVDLRQAET